MYYAVCIQIMYKKVNYAKYILIMVPTCRFNFGRLCNILASDDYTNYMYGRVRQNIYSNVFFKGLVLRFQTFNYKQATKITTMHYYVEDIVVFKVEKCFVFSIPSQAWIGYPQI